MTAAVTASTLFDATSPKTIRRSRGRRVEVEQDRRDHVASADSFPWLFAIDAVGLGGA